MGTQSGDRWDLVDFYRRRVFTSEEISWESVVLSGCSSCIRTADCEICRFKQHGKMYFRRDYLFYIKVRKVRKQQSCDFLTSKAQKYKKEENQGWKVTGYLPQMNQPFWIEADYLFYYLCGRSLLSLLRLWRAHMGSYYWVQRIKNRDFFIRTDQKNSTKKFHQPLQHSLQVCFRTKLEKKQKCSEKKREENEKKMKWGHKNHNQCFFWSRSFRILFLHVHESMHQTQCSQIILNDTCQSQSDFSHQDLLRHKTPIHRAKE